MMRPIDPGRYNGTNKVLFEMVDFVSLSCKSCGGRLQVSTKADRFACGYCGTELLVERTGGTVSLRVVEESLAKISVGTDKTAAELAIQRLTKELNQVQQ